MSVDAASGRYDGNRTGAFRLNLLVGLLAFLTVVDLFAAQAILPSLRLHYGVTPAAMSVAVNASTIGMATSALVTALLSGRIPQRQGVVASLVLLAIPTLLLAHAPDLGTFAALRIMQGICMATAFALSLANLGESSMSPAQAASVFAAYVTGNVASNLVGRILSSGLADMYGLHATFYAFAALNLGGAALAMLLIRNAARPAAGGELEGGAIPSTTMSSLPQLLRDRRLLAAFAIGFSILFAFIGVFTFINFVLARPPFSIGPMSLGLVYLVFAPSIVTTPFVGRIVAGVGAPRFIIGSLLLAGVGIPLLAVSDLRLVLVGLALVAVGTFAAQAATTGFVSSAAPQNRVAASGLYLASYFSGGLVGTAVLGRIFDASGWVACLASIAAVLACAALLAPVLRDRA